MHTAVADFLYECMNIRTRPNSSSSSTSSCTVEALICVPYLAYTASQSVSHPATQLMILCLRLSPSLCKSVVTIENSIEHAIPMIEVSYRIGAAEAETAAGVDLKKLYAPTYVRTPSHKKDRGRERKKNVFSSVMNPMFYFIPFYC